MKKEDWAKYFPYSEIRNQQEEAINFALKSFSEGKKFCVLELGTGCGKSAIGLTIARYIYSETVSQNDRSTGSYFLTTQKILQEQYISDFGGFNGPLKSIKSSSNYTCSFNKASCGENLRALKTADRSSKFWKSCSFNCIYKKAKENFLESKEGVTNFPYFLAETQYSGKLVPRQVLVIDEAHNIDSELSKFIEITISDKFCKTFLDLEIPKDLTQTQLVKWISDTYLKSIVEKIRHFESILEKFAGLKEQMNSAEFISIAKKYEMLDKHVCKIRRFLEIYDKDNWVLNELESDQQSSRKIEFKPIDVAPYANEMLYSYGDFIVIMSATILDKDAFAECVGIDKSQMSYMSMPSPFPIENRPIIYHGIGKMSAGSINETLPKMTEAVKLILQQHKNEKGIVHCIHGDSQITMASGQQKALRDVRPGEYVLSYDEKSKMFEAQKVTNFWNRGIKPTLTLELENDKTIICTPDHKFLTRNREWVKAENLTFEDDIINTENHLKIKSITYNIEPVEVFDIEVEGNHNFVVEGVVAHNCNSYKIANYIKNHVKDARILIHDSSDRDEILEKHKKSKKPTVLISPSMTEGIDLKGDLSRFQVLCKVPYPYLGDKLVRKKMNKWKWWYPLQTAKVIIQSIGRSIRSSDDKAITYVLDSDFDNFFKSNQAMFPDCFKSCIKK